VNAQARTVPRAFGECRVAAGAAAVLFLAYLLWGTALQATQHQHALATELQQEWGTRHGARPVATSPSCAPH